MMNLLIEKDSPVKTAEEGFSPLRLEIDYPGIHPKVQ